MMRKRDDFQLRIVLINIYQFFLIANIFNKYSSKNLHIYFPKK